MMSCPRGHRGRLQEVNTEDFLFLLLFHYIVSAALRSSSSQVEVVGEDDAVLFGIMIYRPEYQLIERLHINTQVCETLQAVV